jgi:hypothetical protein
MACTSLRGLAMYPPAPRTTSRAPDRKPICPSVTIGVLVLSGVQVWSHEGTNREGMFHYGDLAPMIEVISPAGFENFFRELSGSHPGCPK